MTRHSLVWTAVGLSLLSCAHAPETPLPPVGSAWAIADEPAEFVVSGESRGAVSCRIDWGDGDTSIWTQWVTSGVQVATSHAWDAAGVYSISTQARSSDGALSSWSEPASVRVLARPGFPTRTVGHVLLRGKADHVVLAPDGSRLFVYNRRSELAVVRTADLAVEVLDAKPGTPFAVSPDGQYVYGARDHAITKYRVTGWMAVDSLSLGDTLWPWAMVGSPVGDELYIMAMISGSGRSRLLVVGDDPMAVLRSSGPKGDVEGLCCSPDGQALYVPGTAGIVRLDPVTGAQTGLVNIGLYPGIVAMSADSRWLYAMDELSPNLTLVDAKAFVVRDRLPEALYSYSFAALPSGRFVVEPTQTSSVDSVAVYETGSWRLVAKFDPGQSEGDWDRMLPSVDGQRLYLVSLEDSVVQVLGF